MGVRPGTLLRADHSLVLCNPEPRDADRPGIGWLYYGLATRHRRCAGARLLAGGSPLRLLRLTASGARLVDGWMAGEPVGESVAERRLAERLIEAAMFHPLPPAQLLSPAATVVVPVFDDPGGLELLLSGLPGSDGGLAGRLQVIVVDDGSRDADAVAEVADRHGAHLVVRTRNGGPAAARNTGMAEVTTPITVFADADATVSARCLQTLLSHLADPDTACAAPRVRSAPGRGRLAMYEAANSPLDMGNSPSPVGAGRAVAYVPGAVLTVRTEAARAVGGFDEALRWGEDVDFVWRLASAGYSVRYEPAAIAGHRPRPSWCALFAQRRRYGASAAPLSARHGGAAAPVRCSWLSTGAWAAATAAPVGVAAAAALLAVGASAARVYRLSGCRGPEAWRLAVRLAARGHAHAGLWTARAVTRAWWPVLLAASVRYRRLRGALAVATVVSALLNRVSPAGSRVRSPADPADTARLGQVAEIALRVADDAAYSIGVWQGVIAHRSLRAVLPDLRPVRIARSRSDTVTSWHS